MMARTLGQDMPATLARIITPSVRLSIIMVSAVSTATPASAASPALVSSNLPCSAKLVTWNSLRRPSSCSDFTSARAISVCFVMAAARTLWATSCTTLDTSSTSSGCAASSFLRTLKDAFATSFK
ncbi:hypothetical protein ABIA00_007367 [Bradyrhizobium ottawaense]